MKAAGLSCRVTAFRRNVSRGCASCLFHYPMCLRTDEQSPCVSLLLHVKLQGLTFATNAPHSSYIHYLVKSQLEFSDNFEQNSRHSHIPPWPRIDTGQPESLITLQLEYRPATSQPALECTASDRMLGDMPAQFSHTVAPASKAR